MTVEVASDEAEPLQGSLLGRAAHRPGSGVQRILMTADTVGGVWAYALTLAGALIRRGVRVWLAVFTRGLDASQRAQVRQIPGLHVFEGPYRLEWMDDPWDDVHRSGEWLRSLTRVLRPEVVHLNGYVHGALEWPVPRVVVAHSCVCSWWEAVHGGEPPPHWDRYRAEVRRGLRSADCVVAPTRTMLEAVERIHGPLAHARVVHNAARPVSPVPMTAKEPWVLTAGRIWDEGKNIAVLEAAARRIRIRAAGEVRDPSGREHLPIGLDLLGQLEPEAMRRAMSVAAVYAHPAIYEPFGLAPLEAALHGCALVLADIPSFRELWEGAAVFVPPRDGDAWAAALQALLEDDPRRGLLAEAARARAGTFRPERQAEEMLRIYEGARAEIVQESRP
jgi:glycosyltransferase involved in cell wall biosynthesis